MGTAEDVFDKLIANPNRGDTMTTYETDQPRLQITGLKVHQDRGDGTPLCNCWAPGKTFDKLPPGTVTCGLCARSSN